MGAVSTSLVQQKLSTYFRVSKLSESLERLGDIIAGPVSSHQVSFMPLAVGSSFYIVTPRTSAIHRTP